MKTVIFDLSEVLLRGLYGTNEIIGRALGQKIPFATLNIPAFYTLCRGKMTEAEYWQEVIQHNGWPLTVSRLKAAVRENFGELPGTRRVIEELLQKGYTLGLLSVHASEWIPDLEERFRFEDLFHARSYSYETGLLKPAPKAFHVILEKLHVEPKQAIFIDDMSENVAAAARFGMTGIHFTSANALRVELEGKNIL